MHDDFDPLDPMAIQFERPRPPRRGLVGLFFGDRTRTLRTKWLLVAMGLVVATVGGLRRLAKGAVLPSDMLLFGLGVATVIGAEWWWRRISWCRVCNVYVKSPHPSRMTTWCPRCQALNDAVLVIRGSGRAIDLEDPDKVLVGVPVARLVVILLLLAVHDDDIREVRLEPGEDSFDVTLTRTDDRSYQLVPPPRHLALSIARMVKAIMGFDLSQDDQAPCHGQIEILARGRSFTADVAVEPSEFDPKVVFRFHARTSAIALEPIRQPVVTRHNHGPRRGFQDRF